MHKRSFDGIVLFKRPYREHDALVKIFTREYGKLMFFVRGANKANNSLSSQIVPLTVHRYMGTLNASGLSFLQEGVTLAPHTKLRNDALAFAHAIYCAQLIDAALEDHEADPLTYDVFNEALEAFNSGMQVEIVTIFMEIYLLRLFGIHFQWDRCVLCGSREEPFDLSLTRQGVLCSKHYFEDPYRLHANPRAVHIMKQLSKHTLGQIQSIQVSQETLLAMRFIMDEIYKEYVSIHVKAKKFLNAMHKQDLKIQKLMQREKKQADKTPED